MATFIRARYADSRAQCGVSGFSIELPGVSGLPGGRDGDISGILEKLVYLELLRRGYRVSIGKFDDREIDFIAEKQHERVYIQICMTLESPDTQEREFSALERIPDNHPKLVLNLDEYQLVRRGGIQHENLRE